MSFSLYRQYRSVLSVLFLVLFSSLPLPVWAAGQGEAALERFFKGLSTMEARFVQTLLDKDQSILEESDGLLWVSRPGRFRLEYYKPYEQEYVADGRKVWVYDKDLEQITVRDQAEMLGSTPAMLLSGTEPVQKKFILIELGHHEGFDWLELRPRKRESNFEAIRLALEKDVVRAMEMHDALGQTTRLYFHEVRRNPDIPAKRFSFTPPKGVDVIGGSQ